MKTTRLKKSLSFALSIMLVAAIALFTAGCNDNGTSDDTAAATAEITETASEETDSLSDEASDSDSGEDTDVQSDEDASAADEDADVQSEETENSDVSVVGEGATTFTFVVTDADGNESTFEVHTDKTTVGEALVELDLIAGEDSEYGLYVKTVNGITADYDTDGVYWAFYIDGEYAMTGVDSTDITDGAVYSFRVE